jgi:hypothetical protein
MLERREKIIVISKAILSAFSESEWTEIGYLTSSDGWIDSHPRLLRSLRWGDEDYKSNVMAATAHILDKDRENLKILVDYKPITDWLKENDSGNFESLYSEVHGLDVPEVIPRVSTDSGLAALSDAQELLRSRGPTSAVDRLHTGLQAFLKSACDQASISYAPESTANHLLKLLLDNHSSLQDLGPRTDDIKRIIRTSGAIIDALGTLRNRASLAHPNDELLDHDEALLVINIARSLLRYFDGKINVTR